jgi:ATP-dependent DNA helicase RecQ
VHRLAGRFGRGRIVDHLLGKTKEVSEFEAGLSTFGVGREFAAAGWRGLIDQLLFEGLLIEDPNDGRPLIGLGDPAAVRAVYRGERRVSMRHAPGADERGAGRARRRTAAEAIGAGDQGVFEALRAWRRGEAARQAVPPYVIFSDRTLADLARNRPTTAEALLKVNGVGQAKLARYGAAVLGVLGSDAAPSIVDRARGLRGAMSPPEVLLWTHLRGRSLDGLKFRRQHPMGRYVLDFYCPEARLVVEVDGEGHLHGDQPQRDEVRDAWLNAQGLEVLRIPAAEVMRDVVEVADGILSVIRGRRPPIVAHRP